MTRVGCIAVVATVAACHVADVDYTGKSCPCPSGYSCEVATNTCERGPTGDAPADSPIDVALPIDSDACFGSGLATACPSPGWPTTVSLTSTVISTDTSTMCVPAQLPGSCVIVADTVTVPLGAVFSARGTRTLVIVGVTSIAIHGTLDVGSHQNAPNPGAGGNDPSCSPGTVPVSSGGGAGGSFGGAGGVGGIGNGGAGGNSAPAVALSSLRGGCHGQAGAGGGGEGGKGGGGVLLISPGSIVIDGTIDASGQGGVGATVASVGGGGGGSGGLIAIDTPMLTVMNSATLFADGGGGSAGSTTTPPSNNGADPVGAAMAAPGGVGDATGSRTGGDGSVGMTLAGGAGHPSNGSGGGGGGGGGAGFVKLYPPRAIGGAVSPPPG